MESVDGSSTNYRRQIGKNPDKDQSTYPSYLKYLFKKMGRKKNYGKKRINKIFRVERFKKGIECKLLNHD